MSRVILQPSGNKDAREHYENTIQRPVPFDLLNRHLSDNHLRILESYYSDKQVPTWGVTPGKNNVNHRKWWKVQVGDVTLFSSNGYIFASGVVTHKLHHKELAAELWGYDSTGQTWEYIYFLDEIKLHSIRYKEFNKAAGYDENYVIQGFNVLKEELSERILTWFDLESQIYFPEITEEEYREEVLHLEVNDELDIKHSGKRRKEQSFLRRQLFQNKKIGTCGICGKKYPVDLLVAAHIKKRSKCTNEEKLDYKNIVMPMCKFGCDDLFEKGYVIVREGRVQRNPNRLYTPDLLDKVSQIETRVCLNWNNNTRKYFEWHQMQ